MISHELFLKTCNTHINVLQYFTDIDSHFRIYILGGKENGFTKKDLAHSF